MDLTTASDGKLAYEKSYSAKKHVKLSIALTGFNGDNFDAGAGIFRSTCRCDEPSFVVGVEHRSPLPT